MVVWRKIWGTWRRRCRDEVSGWSLHSKLTLDLRSFGDPLPLLLGHLLVVELRRDSLDPERKLVSRHKRHHTFIGLADDIITNALRQGGALRGQPRGIFTENHDLSSVDGLFRRGVM
jgi:hypothetical protein